MLGEALLRHITNYLIENELSNTQPNHPQAYTVTRAKINVYLSHELLSNLSKTML